VPTGNVVVNRPRVAQSQPLINPVVTCGVVTDWIDICTAPETADNGGSVVTNPGAITRSTQNWFAACGLGTQVLVRLKYDAGVSGSITSPVVQVFGRDSAGCPQRLVDGSGTHEQTLTVDGTNDVTDGTYKYTVPKTINIHGNLELLAAIKTAFAATGTLTNSTIQVRVI
jgi:hypothetical protein